MSEDLIKEQVAAFKPIAESLLPDEATPLEKAILTAELARLATYHPEVIATIWDPYKCPSTLLPYLAWALSVDVWDHQWPEEIKRQVIAASPLVHRLKGTRAAVETALGAFGLGHDIKEWWEAVPEGRRGTFSVDVILDENTALSRVPASLLADIYKTVKGAKPKSRVFEIALKMIRQVPVYVGAAGALGLEAQIVTDNTVRLEAIPSTYLGTAAVVTHTMTITTEGMHP